jgi:hypothetical protein
MKYLIFLCLLFLFFSSAAKAETDNTQLLSNKLSVQTDAATRGEGDTEIRTTSVSCHSPSGECLETCHCFVLDTKERLIVKKNYKSTMTVRLDPKKAKGITLRVGAAVFAKEIKLVLLNVKGRGTFYTKLGNLVDDLKLERD